MTGSTDTPQRDYTFGEVIYKQSIQRWSKRTPAPFDSLPEDERNEWINIAKDARTYLYQ